MKLAIIGGSLLKQLSGFVSVSEKQMKTPFGVPSDKLISGKIHGVDVVYLNRHGHSHHLAPHKINYRANMYALKKLDVTHIIALTAVGGISKNMSPMTWVVPNQLIDYTYNRMHTYHDEADVQHIDFSYPFNLSLREKLISTLDTMNCQYPTQATYGVTQGPRLETIAEIKRMQNDGCDIVGMTAMPEAALARELDMHYATLSLVVNWAAGKSDNVTREGLAAEAEVISMEEIYQRVEQGSEIAETVITKFILSLNQG
ncbi:MAG: S-methyl-5'-thioinosine phosphorylase [Gammaproteobacteria bacterium]|nr:S-methyl-5'-thioinosine phosphorylase [Gammaproteobacteria bacterium]